MKISQLLIEFARDFIEFGETVEDMQNHLNIACVAWNIAILPYRERKQSLERIMTEFKAVTPDAEAVENFRNDMNELIKRKNKMFPAIKVSIAKATIVDEGDGDYKIYAMGIQEK